MEIKASNLPPLLDEVTKGVRLKRYPKGQIIFYQGDRPHEIAILNDGYIRVYDIDPHGNEKILHILRPGALVPFNFFSGSNTEIRWFYAALTDCDVYVVNLEEMQKKINDSTELTLFLMHWFSLEVHELLARLSSLGKSSARTKIIAALTFLAMHCAKDRPNGWSRVDFPVNHQLLADMTGVTRESAAMIMKDLVKNACVRNPKQTILEINSKKINQKTHS